MTRWERRVTVWQAVALSCAMLAAAPARAASPIERIDAYFHEARQLVATAEVTIAAVDARALGRGQRADLGRELTALYDPVRYLARLPRTLAREVERYIAWSRTRRAASPGLRELRYQSVLSVSERLAVRLSEMREVLRRAAQLRVHGPYPLARTDKDDIAHDLVGSLWGRHPATLDEALPALERIVAEDQRLQARMRQLADLLERVVTEIAEP